MLLFKSALQDVLEPYLVDTSLRIIELSRMGQAIYYCLERTREHLQGVVLILLLLVVKAIELKSNNSPQVPTLVQHREGKVEAITIPQGQHKTLMKPQIGPNSQKNRSNDALRRLNQS